MTAITAVVATLKSFFGSGRAEEVCLHQMTLDKQHEEEKTILASLMF